MSIINEVKQRIDIVEVISEYIPLQKAGHNFKALCPFHSEKRSSFFVFPEQQTWRCFGCGVGGDVFSFVMKKEEIDFSQALHLLAERVGVTLGSSEAPRDAEDAEKERLFHINEAATEYYHHILLNTKAGEVARAYFSKREIGWETIKEYRLGFSPAGWEGLKQYLIGKGYEEGELVKAGVIIQKEDGSSYDQFRDRLIFPICDIQGRVVAFGARVLDDSLPKYINSARTPVFDKSGSLYGIDKAKTAIRKENSAIIVEGYMDTLAAHQHGWRNVVASMGTSLTEKQVNIIRRLTKNIVLALDADVAGEEATLRAGEILAYSDAEVEVILLPPGKDPDKVISEDLTLWQNLVERATPILDFAFQAVLSKVNINKVKDKSLAVQKLLPLIYEIKDPVQRAHYVQRLARMLEVSESDLTNTLLSNSALTASLRKSRVNQRRPQLTVIEQPRFAHQFVSSPVEEYCLALLFQYPELRHLSQELSAEHFEYTENRELFLKWQYMPDITTLKSKLDPNLLEHLNYLLDKPIIEENDRERQFSIGDCILRLRERSSKRSEVEREAALHLIREEEGVNAELAKLEEMGVNASQQLREIFSRREKSAKATKESK